VLDHPLVWWSGKPNRSPGATALRNLRRVSCLSDQTPSDYYWSLLLVATGRYWSLLVARPVATGRHWSLLVATSSVATRRYWSLLVGGREEGREEKTTTVAQPRRVTALSFEQRRYSRNQNGQSIRWLTESPAPGAAPSQSLHTGAAQNLKWIYRSNWELARVVRCSCAVPTASLPPPRCPPRRAAASAPPCATWRRRRWSASQRRCRRRPPMPMRLPPPPASG
jgi:hypothetical protein